MRDPKRINRILACLEELWNKVPDQRLGQLLDNYFGDYGSFYLEDDLLEDRLRGQTLEQIAFENKNPIWTTLEGQKIYMHQLTDDHILNIINSSFSINGLPMDVLREAAKRCLLPEVNGWVNNYGQ